MEQVCIGSETLIASGLMEEWIDWRGLILVGVLSLPCLYLSRQGNTEKERMWKGTKRRSQRVKVRMIMSMPTTQLPESLELCYLLIVEGNHWNT